MSATPLVKERLGSAYARLWSASFISHLGDGVGVIAYPWLASAVTRSPLLLGLVGAAPAASWLVWSLIAGVVVDRVDRKKLVVAMDVLRGLLTLVAVVGVLHWGKGLPSPEQLRGGVMVATNWPLYFLFLTTSFLLGSATVFRDNSSVSITPSVVPKSLLEKANGRMWSAELIATTFIGPPIGSFLLGVAFALPIFVDAVTFFFCAGLIALIPGSFKAVRTEERPWKEDLKSGVSWLRNHELLWPLAIILAFVNVISGIPNGTYVLFAQEVLNTSPLQFGVMMSGAAIGGVIAGLGAHKIIAKISAPTVMRWFFILSPLPHLFTGLASNWITVFFAIAMASFLGMLFNTVAVSLRQRLVPDELLGRVNGAYRFVVFAGMPFGTLLGGVIVSAFEPFGRAFALRTPMLTSALIAVVLALVSLPILTQERIQRAHAAIPNN